MLLSLRTISDHWVIQHAEGEHHAQHVHEGQEADLAGVDHRDGEDVEEAEPLQDLSRVREYPWAEIKLRIHLKQPCKIPIERRCHLLIGDEHEAVGDQADDENEASEAVYAGHFKRRYY